DALLALDLDHGGRRGVDIHQREVRLAVLAHAVGQGLDAPVLGLGDLAAEPLDHALVLGGELIDLLRRQVLARQEDVFVQWHVLPFRLRLGPAPSPSCPCGRREKKAQKAGTRDVGPTGPAGRWGSKPIWVETLCARPSVQLPAGIERKPGLYG